MLDFLSDEVRRDPYPLFAQARSAFPVLHEPRSGMWLLFDYDSVKRALHDHESFSSEAQTPSGKTPDWLVFMDPPRHSKLRAIIMRAFTPKSIAGLEPRVRELSRALLEPVLERGEMDLVADYSAPLPWWARRTATPRSSPTRTASTSPASRIHTSPSATASTSAWARHCHAWRAAWPSRTCWSG
nr:cytochrome P450 [Pyxidicoccus parkwaysis]